MWEQWSAPALKGWGTASSAASLDASDLSRTSMDRLYRPKARTFLARHAVRLAEKWMDRTLLPIDYPPREAGPRYGYGRPPHDRLLTILGGAEDRYARNLEAFACYGDDLADIPEGPTSDGLAWRNIWLPPLDLVSIYGFLRERAPNNYVEVGSGMSTLCARRAIEDGRLATRITSIDPHPRAEVDVVCDRVVREPLETLDLALFDEVGEGDVVFMDGSHRALTNSDAVAFFLDVLPVLPDGVLVGVHDMLLPDDYPSEWNDFHWSEQYLMAAYLLAEGDRARLELATYFAHVYSDVHHVLEPVWRATAVGDVPRVGVGLWLTTANR